MKSAIYNTMALSVSVATFATSAVAQSLLPTTAIVAAPASTAPASGNQSSVSVDLTHSIINFTLPGTDLTCLNCSIAGTLIFSESVGNQLTGNYHANAPDGLQMHSELQLQASAHSHVFGPRNVPIPGVSIPAAAGFVGFMMQYLVNITLETDQPIDIKFGIDAKVPEGAYIDVGVLDVSDSSNYGLLPEQGLKVDALPVEANVTGSDFTLRSSLRTSLLLGYSSLLSDRFANAGAFVDFPILTIAEDEGVSCDGTNNHEDAIQFEPTIGIDIGAGVYASGVGLATSVETTLVSTEMPLPTTCVSGAANQESVTATLGSVTASATAYPCFEASDGEVQCSTVPIDAAASSTSSA